MNPLLQSPSVPLAEGICQTISDMNADHVMVTQETLKEQLVKKYPGIAVPTHNILYNALGTLIKERKIYHTGEGYFIVTPNTYFITNDAIEDNRKVLLEDSCCCSAPSITHLVNIKPCADLMKENIPTASRYRSCHFFPDQNMFCEKRHRQVMSHESNGGGNRGCSELKPSIQTQGTSAENCSWDTIKSLASLKAKLKSKMLGLGLFWRSGSKKENHKEYSTFSAQFPPQEWPVRDEDDLDNIPRDIEHEIIRRINPTLTVDNLIKHTILMQKFEEQKKHISKEKKYISNGTLAEVPIVRQDHLLKDCIQKAPSNTAKHPRKTKSKKQKQMSRSSRKSHTQKLTSQNVKLEENISLPIKNQEPPDAAVESHGIYKKQIKNPFQGLPWRPRSFHARGYQGVVNSQLKCQARKQGRALQKPQSLASSRPFGCETEQLGAERDGDKAKQNNLLHANRTGLQLKEDILSGNGGYAQSSNLQIGDRSKYFPKSNISEEKSPCSYIEDSSVCKEDAKFPFCLKDERCRCKADTARELLDQTASEFQNVHLSNSTASVNLAQKTAVKYRPKTDKKSELIFNYDCASRPGSVELGSEGFTDNFHLLYQKGHDGDACNLSHLDENSEGSVTSHLSPGHTFSDWSAAVSPKACKVSTCPAQHDTTVNKCNSGQHRLKGNASLAESAGGSKEHPKPDCPEESWLCSQVLLKGPRKDDGTGLAGCGKGSAAADFCQAAEADPDAGTLQNFPREAGEGVARCALGSQIKEGRNPHGKKELLLKNAGPVIPEQNHSEGTENHSVTGDSGIDSPRWTEKKMKLPAKF